MRTMDIYMFGYEGWPWCWSETCSVGHALAKTLLVHKKD